MTLVRKKLSKSGWILLAIIAIVLIALPILHFTGYYSMNFLGVWAVSGAQWAAASGWNVLIVGIGVFAAGFAVCYVLKDYIIGIEGNNLSVTTNAGNTYVPQEKISAPQQTVVNS